ncbi:kinase-like domain-containing protein [Syncephalis fuscata]|nr:kinase-like domain-containing protein [Syncephalis fuscata]
MNDIPIKQRNTLDDSVDYNEKIGAGTFGSVYQAISLSLRKTIAVKMMKKVTDNGIQVDLNGYIRERSVLQALKGHRNIIQLLDAVETQKYTYLFLEYAQGGDLFDYIRRHHPLPENKIKNIFQQLLNGVMHMHKNNIVHGDIKVVLSDFDLAHIISSTNPLLTVFGFTSGYAAPEIILYTRCSDNQLCQIYERDAKLNGDIQTFALCYNGYGKEADAWSLGVTYLIYLQLHFPITIKI